MAGWKARGKSVKLSEEELAHLRRIHKVTHIGPTPIEERTVPSGHRAKPVPRDIMDWFNAMVK